MNVLFAGGGTGGHVFPAVAVAEELSKHDRKARFLFVGSNRGLEARVLPEHGFAFEALEAGALKGLSWSQKLTTIVGLPRTVLAAGRIIRSFSPDVIVGIGGYASAPALLAGRLQAKPALILEQNSVPGLTNRVSAYFVASVAVNFEESTRFFPGNAVVTGNPVRKEFFSVGPAATQGEFVVLIFGGSQGARPINEAVMRSLDVLKTMKDQVFFVHQTGERDFETVRATYEAQGWRADVRVFIEDMPRQFERAHLIVGRAGASTLSEIAAAGRPSILIPLPTAADDHQRRNAEVFASRRAAIMIEQEILKGNQLGLAVQLLLKNRSRLEEMGQAATALAQPEAAARIAELIQKLASKGNNTIH